MSRSESLQSTWWGLFQLENNQTVRWVIGPLKLAIKRLASEWQIAYEHTETSDRYLRLRTATKNQRVGAGRGSHAARFGKRSQGISCRLAPAANGV